jgi:hypothetical protein
LGRLSSAIPIILLDDSTLREWRGGCRFRRVDEANDAIHLGCGQALFPPHEAAIGPAWRNALTG